MSHVPYSEVTNIGYHHRKFSCHGVLASRILGTLGL